MVSSEAEGFQVVAESAEVSTAEAEYGSRRRRRRRRKPVV